MKELMSKSGFAIRRERLDGSLIDIRLRPSRGSAGWSIWKTRRNAQSATYQTPQFKETVIPVTLRLEEREELADTQPDTEEQEE